MNILYITANPLEYSSSANMRNIALISGLIENGHNVSTLSAQKNNNSIYIDKSKTDLNFKRRYWIKEKNISINKQDKNVTIKKKIKEIVYKLYMLFSIYDPKKRLINNVENVKFEDEFDVVISSSDPKSAHLIAEKVIENINEKVKWIQYWGDPFAEDINRRNIIPKAIIKKEEKRIISKANKIIYVSPFTLKKQKKIYKENANKMFFYPVPYIKRKIYNKNITKNLKYSVGYFGNYNTHDRNIMPLYNAISNDQEITLKICGDSNLKLSNRKNIFVENRQAREDIEKYEEDIDLLVCICNKKGTQIPGKIYHYAATNKPILVIINENNQEMKNYFESFNRFILCNNNEQDIINKIRNIIKSNKKYSPCDNFEAKIIAKEVLEDNKTDEK